MTSNYLKTSLRSLKKRWPFTVTNILGLIVGLASFLFLIAYTNYEESFDVFQENKDQLFRVVFERYSGEELKTKSKYNVPAITETIKEEIKDVVGITRYFQTQNTSIIKHKETRIEEPKLFYVDKDFFSMFSVEVIRGNIEEFFVNPSSIVITSSIANKFFKGIDPIGKELKIANEYGIKSMTISGIINDPQKNSILDFKVLCPIKSLVNGNDDYYNNWYAWMFPTFIKVANNSHIRTVENKFPSYVKKYKTQSIEKEITWKFLFQPITDVHLKSGYEDGDFNKNKKSEAIGYLKLIAFLIIIISWINYINLSTASLNERAKEIGVRKSLGAKRIQIIKQFFMEVSLVNIISGILSLFIVFIATIFLKNLLKLEYSFEMFLQPVFWIYFLVIIVVGIVLSGIYPALVLSGFKPSVVLKSKNTTSSTSANVRRALVGVQFLVSILLIASTVIMISQNNYMKNKDLGIDINDVIVLKKPKLIDSDKYNGKIKSFKRELNKLASVSAVSASSAIPSVESWYLSISLVNNSSENRSRHITIGVDDDFMSTYGISMIGGRNFDEDREADIDGALISRKSLQQLGFEKPEDVIGKEIEIEAFDNQKFNIIGVFEDYYHMSLQKKPLAYVFVRNKGLFSSPRFMSVKVENDALKDIKSIYKKFFPNDLFSFYVLSDKFKLQYLPEDRNQYMFIIFSFLTIVLASIGVIGMSSYIAFLKNKEIAIRKVFGADKSAVLWVLTREFLFVLCFAILLSIPLTYYFMSNWLENFSYRIKISPLHIVSAIAVISSITFVIIRINLIKSLNKRPVKALKTL